MTAFGAGLVSGDRAHGGPYYLVSIGGFPNYGDEVITARWLHYLALSAPEAEVWLDTRYPGNASALFAGIHPRLRTTDAVFRAIDQAREEGDRSPEEIARDFGSPLYDLQLVALHRARSIHLLGGGFVNAVWPENLAIPRIMRAVAERTGAKLIATGQGLLPDAGERFEGFDHVSVRDQASADLLGIDKGVDDAFLCRASEIPADAANRETEIVLCIQNDAHDDGIFERLVRYARSCVETWGVPRARVRYVEAIPGGDYAGYRELQDLVAEDGFVPFTRMWTDGFEMGPHQVWITTRFHHHLLAADHGARGIALNGKAGYYDIKHGSITDLGSQWIVTDGTDTSVPSLDELQHPLAFNAYHRKKRVEAAQMYPA